MNKEYIDLINTINKHKVLYYEKQSPVISDYEFDCLFKKLIEFEKQHPELKHIDSPTNKVGTSVTKNKFVLPVKMYSLSNALNQVEFIQFIHQINISLDEIDFCVSLKYDGIAIQLVYNKGSLVGASTRGDGSIGENVTDNIKLVKAIPNKLNKYRNDNIVVTGELVLPKSVFKKLSNKLSNPRNAVSGIIRSSKYDKKILSQLEFFAYNIFIEKNNSYVNVCSHYKQFILLNKLGFNNNTHLKTSHIFKNLTKVSNFYTYVSGGRDKLDFDIDGIVVDINKTKHREKLGVVSNKPKYAIALKFPPEIKKTRLKDVIFQIGRTGIITPVGIVEPVILTGVTVTRFSIYNKKQFTNFNLKKDTIISLTRSGDVIPKILDSDNTNNKNSNFVFPVKCPTCKTELINSDSNVSMMCPNYYCETQQIKRIVYFASKSATNMDGVDERLIQELFDKKIIKDPADLYHLTENKLFELNRMGKKRAKNIITSIQNSKQVTLPKLIYALGISNTGDHVSTLLSKKIKKFENILTLKHDIINDIGVKTRNYIIDYITNFNNIKFIKKLIELNINPNLNVSNNSNINGKVFVFTGSLNTITRTNAKSKIENLNGFVSNSISNKTDYLVIGENPGSKLNKAKNVNIKILNENDFIKLIK